MSNEINSEINGASAIISLIAGILFLGGMLALMFKVKRGLFFVIGYFSIAALAIYQVSVLNVIDGVNLVLILSVSFIILYFLLNQSVNERKRYRAFLAAIYGYPAFVGSYYYFNGAINQALIGFLLLEIAIICWSLLFAVYRFLS